MTRQPVEQHVITHLQALHIDPAFQNYPFETIRKELKDIEFTVDAWILKKREKWISEHKQFQETFKSHSDKIESMKEKCKKLAELKVSIQAELEHERLELEEAESYNLEIEENIKRTLQLTKELEQKFDLLKGRYRRESDIKEQKERHRQLLQLRSLPELELYQKLFAMEIQTIRRDLMKFIFYHIDEKDWSKEFSITVDVSSEQYKVLQCDPPLKHLDDYVKDLNENHKDFYQFLRSIRAFFKKSYA